MARGTRWTVGVAATLVVLLALGALVAGLGARDGGGSSPAGDRSSAARGEPAAVSPTPDAGPGSGRVSGEVGSAANTTAADASGVATPTPTAPVDLGGLTTPTDPTRVVKTATVSVRVGRHGLGEAFDDVTRAVAGAGGFVVDSSRARDRATLTLRVPAPGFETTLATIRGVGRVTSASSKGADVSAEYVDLEARLRNWRAQEAVLLDLMRQARSIADTITVQQQLSQIQQQVEELEGRRRLLDDQTAYGTVTVSLVTRGAAVVTPASRSTLGAAWEDAVGVALAVLAGTLVVLGALLPIVVLGGIGLAGWLVVRRRRPPAGAGPSVA